MKRLVMFVLCLVVAANVFAAQAEKGAKQPATTERDSFEQVFGTGIRDFAQLVRDYRVELGPGLWLLIYRTPVADDDSVTRSRPVRQTPERSLTPNAICDVKNPVSCG